MRGLLMIAALTPTLALDAAQISRRAVLAGTAVSLQPLTAAWAAVSGAATSALLADSIEDLSSAPPVAMKLTDEEMAARIARKQELQLAKARGAGPVGFATSGLDGSIRADINPDAAMNLRSRSVLENAKASMAKQEEMKKRGKAQTRDDLCEMLGRGC